MLQLYIDLALSRLACRDIQPIQPIQPIQLYTLYSIQHYTASLRARGPRSFTGVTAPLKMSQTTSVLNTSVSRLSPCASKVRLKAQELPRRGRHSPMAGAASRVSTLLFKLLTPPFPRLYKYPLSRAEGLASPGAQNKHERCELPPEG